MKYRCLFDLRVRHEFFAGRACPDVRIDPCTRARHRWIVRPLPDGLEVVTPVDADDRPVIALPDDLRAAFVIRVLDVDFHHYTDLGAWHGLAAPTWRGSHPGGGALILGPGDPPLPRGAAARIELSNIAADWLAAPPRFTLELQASSAAWVFYLLTARPGGDLPEIRDEQPARGLAFERVLLTPGAVAEADDPVGHRLLARHPDRRCFRLTSTRPVASTRVANRDLALYRGGELLLRELGSPDIRSRAALKILHDQPSQPSLFRVIEF